MDLLYSRYSNPFEFMRMYIDQGRFGEFVTNIIEMDNKRKKEAFEKENEDKLFEMYIHSMSDKSFIDWKRQVLKGTDIPGGKVSESMTEEQKKDKAVKIINDSMNILEGFDLN